MTGIPAILVPWPGATDDHQRDNIAWLTEVNAAVMLRDDESDGLGDEIDWLRADPLRTRPAVRGGIRQRRRCTAVAPWPV